MPNHLSQYAASQMQSAVPAGNHNLTDVHNTHRSLVQTNQQRRTGSTSPTGGLNDAAPTEVGSNGTQVDQGAVELNPGVAHMDPNVAPFFAPQGAPQPVSMRQHYLHYTPGAFSYSDAPATGAEASVKPAAKSSPVMTYDEQDLLAPDAQGHTSAQSRTSRLNF
jgi:hypothetical protein